jgi:uncharacterized membrane protein YdjX (TVP38/TMEM64 family)
MVLLSKSQRDAHPRWRRYLRGLGFKALAISAGFACGPGFPKALLSKYASTSSQSCLNFSTPSFEKMSALSALPYMTFLCGQYFRRFSG